MMIKFIRQFVTPTKPLICKNCGKKLGRVKISIRFVWRILLWTFLITLFMQLATEIIANWLAWGIDYKMTTHFSQWCC